MMKAGSPTPQAAAEKPLKPHQTSAVLETPGEESDRLGVTLLSNHCCARTFTLGAGQLYVIPGVYNDLLSPVLE